MKKRGLIIATFLIASTFLGASLSFAEEESVQNKDAAILKSLAANRVLLARSTAEYMRLKKKDAETPDEDLKNKADDLNTKIQALNDDRSDLLASLSEEKQAYEMMKDLLIKEATANFPEEEPKDEAETKILSIDQEKPVLNVNESNVIPIAVLHERALVLVSQRNLAEAAKIYEEIILRNPDDDQAYIIMGHTYVLSGEYEKAKNAFQNAVHIDPENINEITPFYENIVLQNPDDDVAYANLGYVYLILGEVIKAKGAFQTALSINPDNGPALSGLNAIQGE